MPSESAYQLVVFSHDQARVFPLPAVGEVLIGRDEANVIRIDDPSVSRQHAILRVGNSLEIEDLGGANGTFVRRTAHHGGGNDTAHVNLQQLVRRKATITVGDCLLFGTVSVVVRHAPRIELPELLAGDVAGTPGGTGAVVRDPAMRRLHTEAARVARASINVLLTGETGVGKEVLARAIHAYSPRAKGPFMGINCAALAEPLLESELFGSEKGAFTGALSRAGLFEAANGGTVFLDEVGELSPGTQAKLLRVLEERVVTRLGATRPRPIDVRFVAATNRDIEADSDQGRFRRDLFFRLNGVTLLIPPLRERPLDIDGLAASFLAAACRDLERTPLTFSTAALDLLRRHAWPGNVRELRNAIERAAVMCTEAAILPEHLPPSLLAATRAVGMPVPAPAAPSPASGSPGTQPGQPSNLQAEMKSLERQRIIEALANCRGNQSEAARLLGMPRRTLVSRLSEMGLTRRQAPDLEN